MRRGLPALAILTIACLSGCGKKDKDHSQPSTASDTDAPGILSSGAGSPVAAAWKPSIKSFVNKDDLKPKQKLKATTAEEVKKSINGLKFTFYAPTSQSDQDPCMDDLLAATVITVKDKVAYFHAEIDGRSCQGSESKLEKLDVTLDGALECEHGDLSRLNGKTFKEYSEILNQAGSKLCDDGKIARLNQSTMSIRSAVSLGDTKIEVENRYINVESTQDGFACVQDVRGGVTKEAADCQSVSLSSITGYAVNGANQPDQLVDDYALLKYQGIEAKAETDLWYSTGSMEVTINEWQGRVEYTSATTEPNYTMMHQGETVKGTIVAPAKE